VVCNGAIGTIDNCREAAYGYDQRAEVFGSKGMAQAENNTPSRHILSTQGGVSSAKPLYFFLERYMEAYIAEMKAFAEAVTTGADSPVTGEDGRAAVVIGLAAMKSFQEGRTVRIAEIGQEETMIKIANAPCSWESWNSNLPVKLRVFRVLDEMQATGYCGTELGDWGFMPTDCSMLKQEIRRRTWICWGRSCQWIFLTRQPTCPA